MNPVSKINLYLKLSGYIWHLDKHKLEKLMLWFKGLRLPEFYGICSFTLSFIF